MLELGASRHKEAARRCLPVEARHQATANLYHKIFRVFCSNNEGRSVWTHGARAQARRTWWAR